MSRRARLLAAALLASFVIGAAACSDITSPRGDDCRNIQGSGTCLQANIQGSGT
jgi:hypothetical protein